MDICRANALQSISYSSWDVDSRVITSSLIRVTDRDLEVNEVLAGDADVLQPRHQLAVEAAHCVAGQEPATDN